MSKSIFFKKIVCNHCGGFFKRRRERGKYKWVCTRRENYGDCLRIPIEEEFLIDVIKKRYEIRNMEIEDCQIRDKVKQITIEDKMKFTIELYDFPDDPIVYGEKTIVY